MQRRTFLKSLGAAGISGAVLAACGSTPDSPSAANTSTDPSTATGPGTAATNTGALRPMNIGFIALTDAASIIMAKELGYFEKYGIDATVTKQANWAAFRDGLQTGQLDAAHALYTLPFSVATKIGGNGNTDLRIAMILNNNGQGITLAKEFAEVGYGDTTKAKALFESASAPELAMTFPGGTHDLWLRYWLATCGVDASTLKIGPVPPPQMVQNMTVGNVKGYCVGEPWNAVAVAQDIGFTTLATQDLWLNHPEKALVTNEAFATAKSDVLADAMLAIIEASEWLDIPANRSTAADTLGMEQYVNAKPDDIRGRLTGVYDLGAGLGTKDFAGNQMQFFRDGQTNAPRRSYGYWALAQYVRLGLLTEAPDYKALVDTIVLSDLYSSVATKAGIAVPDDDMAPFGVVFDNATFDPAAPDAEAARGTVKL